MPPWLESVRGAVIDYRFFRWCWLVAGLVGSFCSAVADERVDELVRIHREAIGGDERVEALHSMRAAGEVVAGGKKMRFTLIAARPNRIRLETENMGRTLVQGSDGRQPPWEFDTGQWPPKYRDMAAAAAKTFAADADFDDPLVGGKQMGYVVEYAGETAIGSRKVIRLLVTRKMTSSFTVMLDAQTYLIVRRVEQRKTPFGTISHVVVDYSDYRPVNGVLIAHDVLMAVDGKPVQQTRIDSIEANPEVAEDAFSRPKAGR